jgi:hypothetical protein
LRNATSAARTSLASMTSVKDVIYSPSASKQSCFAHAPQRGQTLAAGF